jgi:Subtilase family
MPRPTRLAHALTAIGTAAAIAGGLFASPPAQASTPPGSARPTSVTILLKAPDQAGLNRLATAQGLTHAQRVAALAPLLPSPTAHREVAAQLRSAGFTITDETDWTITAQAQPATVTAAFGARTPAPPNATKLEQLKAASSLPRVPSAIAGLTAAVLPTSGGPGLFSPLDKCRLRCRNGTDFRNAYTAPKVKPATGVDASGPLTIATLQFAGWNPSDLSKYAASVGMTNPVGTAQYTQIPVGEPNHTVPPAPPKGSYDQEADVEVDLDQEAILSTDPNAYQRAYFNPNNTAAGYAQDIGKVLADVTQGPGDFNGGDPQIVALSTSWGSCESEFRFAFDGETIKAVENILKSLTAAGVTVFAASGDNGIYDCGDSEKSTKIAVDYPGSSPEVVSVGGTRLRVAGAHAANIGGNWVDDAWSCSSAEVCQGVRASDTGGSGGGESKVFRMPAYQAAGLAHDPFTTTTGKKGRFGSQPDRLVPDIADDGDPATGFEVLTSDPTDVKSCAPHSPHCVPESFAIGGTSLSSPEAAALFTDMLAAHNVTAGVGDIHDALYSAYASHTGAFRDIRHGSNGAQRDVDDHHANGSAYELPVRAEKGFDTVTGLGAPLWPRIAPYLFTPAAPTAKASMSLSRRHSPTLAPLVTASWRGVQAAKDGSAAATAAVTITRNGTPLYRAKSARASDSYTFAAPHGGDYLLTVTERDLAGQHSSTIARVIVVPHDDRSFTFHGHWVRVKDKQDYRGSYATTHDAGAYATASDRGRRYTLEVRTGPMYGELAIDEGTTTIGTYNLYSPKVKHIAITFFGSRTTALHFRTFTFRYTGHKDPHATSATVNLDALYVLR